MKYLSLVLLLALLILSGCSKTPEGKFSGQIGEYQIAFDFRETGEVKISKGNALLLSVARANGLPLSSFIDEYKRQWKKNGDNIIVENKSGEISYEFMWSGKDLIEIESDKRFIKQ